MQAVVMRETGGPEVLRLEQVERPEPGEGEVLVRVKAAAVNPIDWKYRRGLYPKKLPAVPGNDVSGTVELSRAEGAAVGDEVFGIAKGGGYVEFAIVPAGALAKKPAGVSHSQAAALPVAGMTAWQALFDRAGLERGQSALVAGAAGGVGHLAVQFAKHAGAQTIGTGSARNREFVLGLGADRFIDYRKEDVSASVEGVDVAFDTVGGDVTESLLPTLREGGILITIAGPAPEAAAQRGARAENLVMSPNPEQLSRIVQLVAEGSVHVEIAETLPLAEVQRAHELIESGHTRGKIILAVDS